MKKVRVDICLHFTDDPLNTTPSTTSSTSPSATTTHLFTSLPDELYNLPQNLPDGQHLPDDVDPHLLDDFYNAPINSSAVSHLI